VLNAACSKVQIDKYLSDLQVDPFKSGLKQDGASSVFPFKYELLKVKSNFFSRVPPHAVTYGNKLFYFHIIVLCVRIYFYFFIYNIVIFC